MSLREPVFTVWDHGVSWRDLILIGGGLFLLVKATTEMHDRLEAQASDQAAAAGTAAFWPVVAQIVVLDIVFSLDSVITAVGMVDELYVMMAAVIVAVIVMFVAAAPLSAFINARPSLIILCLGFLLMIGLVLVADGLGVHVPKGYVYAAIAFSALIETFNQIAMRNRRKLAATIPPRQRMAHAVLRMLGGVPLPGPGALAVEAAGTVPADAPAADVFAPLERRMVRGVLELARRPVTAIMTHRADVQWIDAAAGRDAVLGKLRASPYRGFPVGHGSIDKLLGVVRKDDVLALYLHDKPFELERVMSEAIAMPASITVYDALERFKGAPLELAIVADEYGGVAGVVTRTDLLEAITGDLPEHADEPPEIEPLARRRVFVRRRAAAAGPAGATALRHAARRPLPDRRGTRARDPRSCAEARRHGAMGRLDARSRRDGPAQRQAARGAAGGAAVRRGPALAFAHRDDRFDLDGDVARQRPHADGRARMAAVFLAEDVDEEIRAAVDDERVLFEIGRGVDHAEQLDDALHAREVTEHLVQHREQVHADEPRVCIGLCDADVHAHLAGVDVAFGADRPLPGQIDQPALEDMRPVARHRLRRRRQREAARAQLLVAIHQAARGSAALRQPRRCSMRSAAACTARV